MLPSIGVAQPHTLESLMQALFEGAYLVDNQGKILFWNEGAFFISGYRSDEVAGRCCSDNILVHVDDRGIELCKHECPLQRALQDGKPHQASIFLRHRLGYRVPVSVRIVPIYGENGKITGAMEVFRVTWEASRWKLRIDELEKLVFIDPVTSVPNRRFLESQIDQQLQEFACSGVPFTACMLDLDHFKAVNDQYGHQAGDRLLQNVCRTLVRCLRAVDILGRWGGDELVLLLPSTTIGEASKILRRMRLLISETVIAAGPGFVRTTVSIGAVQALPSEDQTSLLRRADAQLYLAKQHGRNRCCLS
jgi:diguanylate cyclase (GGDEF)-like protein/PAS domain S-box-containing protein